MYLGHLGVSLWAKGRQPALPLSLLLIAALGPDWIEIGTMFAGDPNHSLNSHGFLVAGIGLAAFCAVTALLTRSSKSVALVAGVYVSHILLDFLTGQKPTWPGGPLIGLHWYAHPLLDFISEAAVLAGGWLVYQRSLPPSARSRTAVYVLLVFLVSLQAAFDLKLAHGSGMGV